jgi:hypothetical protein
MLYSILEKTIELVASLVISVPADDGSRELLAIQGRAVADEYFTIAHHAVIFLARSHSFYSINCLYSRLNVIKYPIIYVYEYLHIDG